MTCGTAKEKAVVVPALPAGDAVLQVGRFVRSFVRFYIHELERTPSLRLLWSFRRRSPGEDRRFPSACSKNGVGGGD
jgi:hypothetical protein